MKLSVVAPCYNEASIIESFIKECYAVLESNFTDFELILVDDGSKDDTLSVLVQNKKDYPKLIIIQLSRNFGKEWALTCGIEQAKGEVVIVMDSDLQDPPALIVDMVKKLDEGYDIIHAYSDAREGEGLIKKCFTSLFYRSISKWSGLSMPEHPGNFLCMKRHCVDAVISLKEYNRYFKMLIAYIGFDVGYIPFHRHKRSAGTTKFGVLKLISLAIDVTVSFSIKPLKIISIISLIFSFGMMLVSVWAIVQKFIFKNAAYGWASTFLLISSCFCIVFIFLFLISEYIARILVESKQRPLYFIKNKIQ